MGISILKSFALPVRRTNAEEAPKVQWNYRHTANCRVLRNNQSCLNRHSRQSLPRPVMPERHAK
jgi:hypothetical protein